MRDETGLARKAIPLLLCMAIGAVAAACETKYPDRPPLREVKTKEDSLYFWCLREGILQSAPECDRYVGGRER